MKRILFTALLACATAAFAKDEGPDPAAACKADFERLCKGVQPGDGRIMKCMMDNKSRVSPACASAMDQKRQEEQAVGQDFAACKQDYERFCKGVQPGGGRIMQCMVDNQSRVSAPCAAVLAAKEKEEEQRKLKAK